MKSILDKVGFAYLFLDSVIFAEGVLTINLTSASKSDETVDIEVVKGHVFKSCNLVDVDENSIRYKVVFDDTVSYQVIGESANLWEENKADDNGVIAVINESPLQDYLHEKTLMYLVTSGKITHYCVATADEWLHVFSRSEPEIMEYNDEKGTVQDF